MLKLPRFLKDYQESGAFNTLVSVHSAIADQIFLTKGGDLMAVMKVQGIDDECLDPASIDQLAQRFEAGARLMGEHFRVYQYLIKRSEPSIPASRCEDPAVQAALQPRADFLKERSKQHLYSVEMYWAIVYEGWKPSTSARHRWQRLIQGERGEARRIFSVEAEIRNLERELGRAQELFLNYLNALVVQLRDTVSVEVLGIDAAYRFLRSLVNYAPFKVEAALQHAAFVDFSMCDSHLECHRDHLRLDDYFVRAYTLKDLPGQTSAHFLRELEQIPANFIVVSEWKREPNAAIRSLIHSKRRHFHNSKAALSAYLTSSSTSSQDMLIDDGAVGNVSDLGGCLRELEINGNYFGSFSMTVVLFDEDPQKLQHTAAEVFKVFASRAAQLTEERYNLLNSWLAVLPGNSAFNLRRQLILNTNYADLALLYQPSAGEVHNLYLGAEYLAALETEQNSPFFLNLHSQDVAHTLIVGATGSGKSFLLNFLITQLQKYLPVTYIFDLGGSYRTLAQLFGGVSVRMGVENSSFSINPFSLVPTKENLQFQFSFVKLLIESGGLTLTAQDDADLYEQIVNMSEIDPDQRRLGTLARIVNRRLAPALSRWVAGGQYGSLFDNATDNLTCSRFTVFDFEGMDKYPQVLEPLLFYILHRASAAVADEANALTLKAFVMDEAWRFLQHSATRSYIHEALKTWRKRNAAMILATQSSDDLLRSQMLSVAVESCPTKLFLANPGMDQQAYREIFHLNEREAQLIARLVPKKQFLLKRPDMAKVLNLNVDRKGYWLYTNSPADNQRKREAFAQYGLAKGLEILAKEQTQ